MRAPVPDELGIGDCGHERQGWDSGMLPCAAPYCSMGTGTAAPYLSYLTHAGDEVLYRRLSVCLTGAFATGSIYFWSPAETR